MGANENVQKYVSWKFTYASILLIFSQERHVF